VFKAEDQKRATGRAGGLYHRDGSAEPIVARLDAVDCPAAAMLVRWPGRIPAMLPLRVPHHRDDETSRRTGSATGLHPAPTRGAEGVVGSRRAVAIRPQKEP
jgi:hypothetical protein